MAVTRILVLIVALTFYFLSNPCYSEIDTLKQGEQLKDWDCLISSNRVFSLKFFSFGTSISPYLGIFYKNNDQDRHRIKYSEDSQLRYGYNSESGDRSDYMSNKAVWVANRDNPIQDIYGKLMIDVQGKLSILSGGSTVLDLFTPTPIPCNASAKLLDNGNFVLQELHPDGSVKKVLWQSFDYPTDILLPGMKLGINHETGHRWSLTSWRSEELPASGSFTLTGDPNGTGQLVILRRGNVHWMSGPWHSGQFNNTDLQSSGPDVHFYYVSNETEQSFSYLTKTYDSSPALVMLPDGLMGSVLKFEVKCQSINEPGCAENELEELECRKDYHIRRGDDRRCGWEDDYHIYLDEYVYDESYNLTLYDCQKICWSSCSCIAYTYATKNKAGCKTFGRRIYNPAEAYKYREKEIYTIEYDRENKENWIVLIIMIGSLVFLLS